MQTAENSWLREIDAGARVRSIDRAQGRWTAPASAGRGEAAQSLGTS